MYKKEAISVKDASIYLSVSEDLILKFINLGFIKPIYDGTVVKLSAYNLRRLKQVLDMYERCLPTEKIELILNN
jgi:hypothetical protein